MDPDEHDQLNRVVDHEVKGHFPPGAVRRAVLLRHGNEPGIEPGQLRLRVFVPAEDAADEQALATWRNAHRAEVDELRRDLSRRLPSARLLEFTFDDAGPDTPRITVQDDGSQAAEQLSARGIVTRALELLRATTCSPSRPSGPLRLSRRGWRPASTTTWTRSSSPS